jgi:hypothetical protein
MSKTLGIFVLTLAALGEVTHASVTAEFLGVPTQISTREKASTLYVVSKGGQLANVKCWISALVPDHGDPAPPDALQCNVPTQIDADKIEEITLTPSSSQPLKRGTYTASLQLLGLDQSGAAVTQTVTFKVVVPAACIKIGETDPLRLRITRAWPFSAAREFVPVAFHVTSDLPPTKVPSIPESEIYVPEGASKDIIPGGYLKAQFCTAETVANGQSMRSSQMKRAWSSVSSLFQQSQLCTNGGKPAAANQTLDLAGLTLQIEPSVPSNVKEATGTLHLQSSEFANDLDIPVTLLVKDWWIWAAMVVFSGQMLSFFVSSWINTGRKKKLNKLAMGPVESGLVNLLLTRPDLVEDNPAVAGINTLLNAAVQANRLGEVDAAVNNIKSAQTKLDELQKTPITTQQAAASPPRILMLQNGHAYVGRRLNFVIVNPDPAWKNTAMYEWKMSGVTAKATTIKKRKWFGLKRTETPITEARKRLFEAQDLKDIATEFDAPDQYCLKVYIDQKDGPSLTFRVETDKTEWSQWKIANIDNAILLLAVIFAAILSYLAIDNLETFGTVSDYALAFLGGFGLHATTSGFSAVFSRFGGSSQGTTSAAA